MAPFPSNLFLKKPRLTEWNKMLLFGRSYPVSFSISSTHPFLTICGILSEMHPPSRISPPNQWGSGSLWRFFGDRMSCSASSGLWNGNEKSSLGARQGSRLLESVTPSRMKQSLHSGGRCCHGGEFERFQIEPRSKEPSRTRVAELH